MNAESSSSEGSPTGFNPEDALGVLGNRTRLAILFALWEAYDSEAVSNSLSFSELYGSVDYDNPGNFSYHVNKLLGHYIDKTDEGYRLRYSGHKLVRSVIAGNGDATLDRVSIGLECPFCQAPKEITYEDERLIVLCSKCDGAFGGRDVAPTGALSILEFEQAGLMNRSPAEIFTAATVSARSNIRMAVAGVCNECSGKMEKSLDVCEDHDPEGLCGHCRTRFAVLAAFHCPVCKNFHKTQPWQIVKYHSSVVAFFYERGVELPYEINDFNGIERYEDLIEPPHQELVGRDPVRMRVTFDREGDTLELMLDEELAVVSIEEGN